MASFLPHLNPALQAKDAAYDAAQPSIEDDNDHDLLWRTYHDAKCEPLGNDVKCAPPSGITVLIVGAGVGGLTAALECHRKGHVIRIFERSDGPATAGDMFTIGASALNLLAHYPTMAREYNFISIHNLWMRYRHWTGTPIGDAFAFTTSRPGAESTPGTDSTRVIPRATLLRPFFHKMLLNQLYRFGLAVEYNKVAVRYYESPSRSVARVVLANGDTFEADLVIAADGRHSRSNALVPSTASPARPTGRTIFRCAFPLQRATSDPLVNESFGLMNGLFPQMEVFLGRDMHAVVLTYVDAQGENGTISISLTFRDEDHSGVARRRESWSSTTSSDEVLKVMSRLPSWAPALKALVRAAPADGFVAWPLNPRNLNSTWFSPHGRVLQIGDAAHACLPTSGKGPTHAMEDAISIAACLAKVAHCRKDVPVAVRVHTLLRVDRVGCCQLLGFVNAERLQKTDCENFAKDPSKVQQRVPRWVWEHDPEVYVEDNFERARVWLSRAGKGNDGQQERFVNENIPMGYVPSPWTVDGIEEMLKRGEKLDLTGDWT